MLVNDNEQEVKQAAITSITKSLRNVSKANVCNIVLPSLEIAYEDCTPKFKAGAASTLCDMSHIVGPELTQRKIYPILETLLKAENSEAEVKLAVVKGLI